MLGYPRKAQNFRGNTGSTRSPPISDEGLEGRKTWDVRENLGSYQKTLDFSLREGPGTTKSSLDANSMGRFDINTLGVGVAKRIRGTALCYIDGP